MNDKKLLIVGLDPGTTTAIAVLGIEGNLVHIDSSKSLDLNSLISETLKLGKVILAGTDKHKVPNLVETFATKLGARVVNPEEDLRVEEKRAMTSNFSFKDEHQADALASALFAYKSIRPLLNKINIFVQKNKMHEARDRIKEIVLTKRISIKSALSLIERKEGEDRIIEKVIAERRLKEEDFLKLYDKLKKYEIEVKLLRRYNNKLKRRIMSAEKKVKREKTADKTYDFRENRIKFLESILRAKEKSLEDFKFLIKKYNAILSNINDLYVLKKLDTLGRNELNFKNKVLGIKRNDILLVDNPNIVSNDVVDFLRDNVFVIVHKKPLGKKMNEMPFIFIDARHLEIDEDRYFGFVEKKQFEIEKNKLGWAKKMIEDYKKEKELLR